MEATKVIETILGVLFPIIIAGLGYLAYNKPDEYLRALRRLSLILLLALFLMSICFFSSSWLEINTIIEKAPEGTKADLEKFKNNIENKLLWITFIAAAPFFGIQFGEFIREIRDNKHQN